MVDEFNPSSNFLDNSQQDLYLGIMRRNDEEKALKRLERMFEGFNRKNARLMLQERTTLMGNVLGLGFGAKAVDRALFGYGVTPENTNFTDHTRRLTHLFERQRAQTQQNQTAGRIAFRAGETVADTVGLGNLYRKIVGVQGTEIIRATSQLNPVVQRALTRRDLVDQRFGAGIEGIGAAQRLAERLIRPEELFSGTFTTAGKQAQDIMKRYSPQERTQLVTALMERGEFAGLETEFTVDPVTGVRRPRVARNKVERRELRGRAMDRIAKATIETTRVLTELQGGLGLDTPKQAMEMAELLKGGGAIRDISPQLTQKIRDLKTRVGYSLEGIKGLLEAGQQVAASVGLGASAGTRIVTDTALSFEATRGLLTRDEMQGLGGENVVKSQMLRSAMTREASVAGKNLKTAQYMISRIQDPEERAAAQEKLNRELAQRGAISSASVFNLSQRAFGRQKFTTMAGMRSFLKRIDPQIERFTAKSGKNLVDQGISSLVKQVKNMGIVGEEERVAQLMRSAKRMGYGELDYNTALAKLRETEGADFGGRGSKNSGDISKKIAEIKRNTADPDERKRKFAEYFEENGLGSRHSLSSFDDVLLDDSATSTEIETKMNEGKVFTEYGADRSFGFNIADGIGLIEAIANPLKDLFGIEGQSEDVKRYLASDEAFGGIESAMGYTSWNWGKSGSEERASAEQIEKAYKRKYNYQTNKLKEKALSERYKEAIEGAQVLEGSWLLGSDIRVGSEDVEFLRKRSLGMDTGDMNDRQRKITSIIENIDTDKISLQAQKRAGKAWADKEIAARRSEAMKVSTEKSSMDGVSGGGVDAETAKANSNNLSRIAASSEKVAEYYAKRGK